MMIVQGEYYSDKQIKNVRNKAYRKKNCIARGWQPVPEKFNANPLEILEGADIDGKWFYQVQCEECGHFLQWNQLSWQWRHEENCKGEKAVAYWGMS